MFSKLPFLLRFLFLLDAILLSTTTFFAQNTSSYSAQDSISLRQLINDIDRVVESGPADSVNYFYEKKANFYRQKDDLTSWLDTYWDWQYYFDEPERSLKVIDDGLEFIWRTPKKYSEWESLLWIYASKGYLHSELGQIVASIQALEEADRIFINQEIEDFNIVEYVYQLMGTCLTMIGDNEKARYIYEKALRHANSYDIKGGLYNNIGLTYWNEAENGQAIKEYQKGLSIDSLPHIRRGQLLSNLAKSMQEGGQLKEALNTAQSAVSMLTGVKESEHPDYEEWVSGAYYILGYVLTEKQSYAEARRAFEQALKFAFQAFGSQNHRTSAKIYIALGKLAALMGQHQEAIQQYHAALTSVIPSFRPEELSDLPSAVDFYEENAIYQALEGKADALYSLYAEQQNKAFLKAALSSHDLAYKAENMLREVLENESAKLLLQSYRRNRTEKALQVAYHLYRETGEEDYLQKAFLIAEQSKASLLLDNIRENLAKSSLQLQDSLFVRERALLRYYSFYDKEYQLADNEAAKKRFLFEKNAIGDQLEDLREEIQKKYPGINAVTEKEISLNEVREWLASSTTDLLIEYYLGDRQIYIFSIEKDASIKLEVIDHSTELQARAQTFIQRFNFREAISNQRAAYLEEAHQLYTSLFGSLKLSEEASLTIIPDGWLNFLPFSALISSPHTGSWLNAPFLLKKWKIGYGYSLATLFYLKNLPVTSQKNLLGVAPGFDERPRGLPPLGFSREEVKAIRIPVKKTMVDQQARLVSFRQQCPDYRILHLSTHAQGTGLEVPPHIEFIDSTLYLPEIYTLQLQADLVTLSACETGLGRLAEGEGVMSLSRGFTFAGAASLIASLWTVNEASTAQLFARFYEDIGTGRPKMEALRQTKLDYLQDPDIPSFQKSPYYWAGFVYYGNEGVIPLEKDNQPFLLLAGVLLVGIVIGIILFRKIKSRDAL